MYGTCIRDYVHVVDIAQGHILAINCFAKENEKLFTNSHVIYNMGTNNGYSVKEVFDTYQRVNNIKFDYDFVGRRPGDAAKALPNCEKIAKEFDMKRLITVLLIMSLSFSLFSFSITSYRPLDREYRAMGSSGMSLKGVEKGFYTNPASLSNDKFNLVLPSLEMGVGSFTEIATIPFSSLGEGDFDAINEVLSKLTGTIPVL